jgi:hypothetical protein
MWMSCRVIAYTNLGVKCSNDLIAMLELLSFGHSHGFDLCLTLLGSSVNALVSSHINNRLVLYMFNTDPRSFNSGQMAE